MDNQVILLNFWEIKSTPVITQREIVQYYIGNYFHVTTPRGNAIMKIDIVGFHGVGFIPGETDSGEWWELEPFQDGYTLRPYLRSAGVMSEQEKTEYYERCKVVLSATRESAKWKDLKNWKHVKKIVDTPLSITWLIRNGFDAFDLIENGMALDISKLPKRLLIIE